MSEPMDLVLAMQDAVCEDRRQHPDHSPAAVASAIRRLSASNPSWDVAQIGCWVSTIIAGEREREVRPLIRVARRILTGGGALPPRTTMLLLAAHDRACTPKERIAPTLLSGDE